MCFSNLTDLFFDRLLEEKKKHALKVDTHAYYCTEYNGIYGSKHVFSINIDTKSGNPFDSTNISQPPSPEIVGEEVAAESKQPWMEDDTFLNGQIKTLCREEVTFWNSLIKKYLDPNEKGKKEQNRVVHLR